jgi:hypothetical protein
VQFESTLRYVQFPDRDHVSPNTDHSNPSIPRTEVPIVLKWLREVKKVTTIVELNVPDSYIHPHSEETIENAIAQFDVQILNWRRLDVSVECVKVAARQVRSLSLYSSGNWAAIRHWTSSKGICELEFLRDIVIHVVEDNITEARYEVYQDRAIEELSAIQKRGNVKWKLGPTTIQSFRWGIRNRKKGDEGTEYRRAMSPSTATQLKHFIEDYGNIQRERKEERPSRNRFRPIKIAILDNGVSLANNNIQQDQLAEKIKEVKSFVSVGDRDCPWWLASDLHGTKMGSFITEMDPSCELYVAKVSQKKHDISVEQ